jgi:16S rRNA processing protein RimM
VTAPTNSRLIVVAQVAGAFGVKGEVRVRSFTADPEACFDYGPLMDEAGAVVLTPLKHRPLNEGYGVTAKEKRQREEWEALKGALLHAPRDAMPAPEEDEVYVADLIGLAVVHVDGRALGVVADAPNFGAGDLIEVKPASGASFYLPFTHAVVPEVNIEAGVVRVSPDEDLLPDALQLSPTPQRHNLDGETN